MIWLLLLLAYLVFGSLAICMLFNWIATGNPNRFPFDDDSR